MKKKVLVCGAVIVTVAAILLAYLVEKDRRRKKQTPAECRHQLGMNIMSAPLNVYFEKQSEDPTTPIVDMSHHPELIHDFESNWQTIRDEGLRMTSEMNSVKNDLFFSNISKDDAWRKMYLKWYGEIDTLMVEKCPTTCAILAKHPKIKLAMFSLLKAGGRILPHAGPFRGCIRIHVGLKTPNDDDCFIRVADQTYSWRDGEVVAFDDTYRHEVFNNTAEDRLILFLDFERTMKSPFATRLNQFFIKHIAPLTTRNNNKLEKVVI